MSFVLTNGALANYEVNYAFSGEKTGSVMNGDFYNSYSGNNPYMYGSEWNNYNNTAFKPISRPVSNPERYDNVARNPGVVNNYYYGTIASTDTATKTNNSVATKTTNTTTNKTSNTTTTSNDKVASAPTSKTDTKNSIPPAKEVKVGSYNNSGVYSNNLGASAYGSVSSRTSGSFMPNTILGWILTTLVIMAIVVVYRLIVRKNREVNIAIKA